MVARSPEVACSFANCGAEIRNIHVILTSYTSERPMEGETLRYIEYFDNENLKMYTLSNF
jgi:hypothetical protein